MIIEKIPLQIKQNGMNRKGVDLSSSVLVFKNSIVKFMEKRGAFHFECEFEQLLLKAFSLLNEYKSGDASPSGNSRSDQLSIMISHKVKAHIHTMIRYLESKPFGISISKMVRSHECHLRFCKFLYAFSIFDRNGDDRLFIEYLLREHEMNILPILQMLLYRLNDSDLLFHALERNLIQIRKIQYPIVKILLNQGIVYTEKFESIMSFIKKKRPDILAKELRNLPKFLSTLESPMILQKLQLILGEMNNYNVYKRSRLLGNEKRTNIAFMDLLRKEVTNATLSPWSNYESFLTRFKEMKLSKLAPQLFGSVLRYHFRSEHFTLDHLRVIVQEFPEEACQITEELVGDSLHLIFTLFSSTKIPSTLRYLVEECNIEFKKSYGLHLTSNNCIIEPEKYIEEIEWIFEHFNVKLTSLSSYIYELCGNRNIVITGSTLHFETIYNILTVLPKKFEFKLGMVEMVKLNSVWPKLCAEPKYLSFDFTTLVVE